MIYVSTQLLDIYINIHIQFDHRELYQYKGKRKQRLITESIGQSKTDLAHTNTDPRSQYQQI